MKIKDLTIKGKTFLAPLAGVTNLPFRLLVKECGCAVVCSEMISAKGLFYNSEKTMALLASEKGERPLSVQIFGSEPDPMARAAAFIQGLNIADILDINFGCSVKKVIKQGAGVSLMKSPERTRDILLAVRKNTTLPLSIKIRSGWDPSGKQALLTAKIAQDCGVDLIAVHPRTASQLFKGRADWQIIKKIKAALSIPVIGNGDISSVADAVRMMDLTGCDAVMVGRAAMRNPFILSQIEAYLQTGTYPVPDASEIFTVMGKLTKMYVEHFGETTACKMLRGRLPWFVKGMPGCSMFRKHLSGIQTAQQAMASIREFESGLSP